MRSARKLAEAQAASDSARRRESPLPHWMAEARVPASARKGAPLSLSSPSTGEAERLRSRPGKPTAAAGPSGAQQPRALEARRDLVGARAQSPAPLGAGQKQGGGAAAATPFAAAAHTDAGAAALPCCSMALRACLWLVLVLWCTCFSRAQDLPSGASSQSSGTSQAPALPVDTPR